MTVAATFGQSIEPHFLGATAIVHSNPWSSANVE
jgi:hypothetical protein